MEEVRAAAAEAEVEAETARAQATEARTRAAVLEEMASLRKERTGTTTTAAAAAAAAEEAATAAAAEAKAAAAKEIDAAKAQAETAMAEVARLTEKLAAALDAEGSDGFDQHQQNHVRGVEAHTKQNDEEDEDEALLRARLASILTKLRSSGAPNGAAATAKSDGDIWSWAFGTSDENAAAKARRAGVDAAGSSAGGDGAAPSAATGDTTTGDAAAAAPVSALLSDLERWAADGGHSWSQALMEQSRRVATDAIARARAAEEASKKSSADLEAARARTSALQAAQAKRAAAAEEAAAEVAAKLEAAEKKNKELSWQVSMLAPDGGAGAGQGGGGGGGEQRQGPGGWLAGALKGCVAPRPGRGR